MDHSGTNDFYSINTELAGFLCSTRKWRADDKEPWTLGNEELYSKYKHLYESVSQTGLDIKDEEGLQSEEASTTIDDNINY